MRPQVNKNSIQAYYGEEKDGNNKRLRHRIHEAFKVLKKANKTQLSEFLGITEERIGRRLSELENEGLIYRTGESIKGSSGRKQTVFQIIENQ